MTRQAVDHAAFVLHNTTRCGSQNGWPLIGQNLSLQQCEANCTASARCGAFSYCDAAAGATGCAVSYPAGTVTSRCFQFPDMSQCIGGPGEVGWTSGLRSAPRPKPDKQIVASLATASAAIGSWAPSATPAGFAEGKYFEGTAAAAATVSLTPDEVVSVFTVFADNSLSGPDTIATAAVAELATARAAAAVEAGTKAAAVQDAADAWWLEFWQQSSIELPTRPSIERFWSAISGSFGRWAVLILTSFVFAIPWRVVPLSLSLSLSLSM